MRYELLRMRHAEGVLAFEEGNREFFEGSVPPRGDEYYHIEHIRKVIKKVQPEMLRKNYLLYVIIDEATEEIIGRINLFNIDTGMFSKGEVGYRIAESHCGKGVATKALKWLCEVAKEDVGLNRLEAGTAVENIGSQIVLIKNGFQFVGRAHQFVKINGHWQDAYHFEKLL